ncbi:hypothetical protein J2W42_006426 [Rhizobium tibeticum]|nr:hypothetical protein [Rhizobium tibeticum]
MKAIAFPPAKPRCLTDSLNAFRGNPHSQAMCKADDEAHDGLALRVGLDILDEVPVDLDRVERKVLQIAQG